MSGGERKAILLPGLVLIALLLGGPRPAAAYETIIDSGPPENRVDIVFLGDGYTAADIAGGAYAAHVNSVLSQMFDESEDPFPRYRNFFNVYRVDLVSNESGADKPPEGIFRDTALDASYYWDAGAERALYIDDDKANAAVELEFGEDDASLDVGFVTVNDTTYGGTTGSYAVFSGGHGWAPEIALHELGHSFGQLADEYWIDGTTYSGPEPLAANATKESDPALVKWADWIGYTDANHPLISEIGVFEGAAYNQYGLYRPSYRSKMRDLHRPFDAVSREQVILAIYRLVDPLDGWEPNDAPLTNPPALWVDVIDPNLIDVQWHVDGLPVAGATGETFNLADHGYGAGTYQVTAVAADTAISDWVRRDLDDLQMSIAWTVELTFAPPGLTPGDMNDDGNIDNLDISAFVYAMVNGEVAFALMYPDGEYWAADCRQDGNIDNLDITPFTELIAGGGAAVPEPAGVLLLGLMLPALTRRRQSQAAAHAGPSISLSYTRTKHPEAPVKGPTRHAPAKAG